MAIRFLFLFAFLFAGCASRGEKLKAKYGLTNQEIVHDVPFIEQADYFCGPATLAMNLKFIGSKHSTTELSSMLFTPHMKGTLQNDMISATRRLGVIAIPVTKMIDVINTVKDGHPVLIFQNLGLSWYPRWHYALVVGYNLQDSVLILHSGKFKNMRMKISTFENTWARVENWGLIIVQPGSIPQITDENEMLKASAGLELAGHFEKAKMSYEAILKKWPLSSGAYLGLGNISYQMSDYPQAIKSLKRSIELKPDSAGAWFNYAIVLIETGDIKNARPAASKAIALAGETLKASYQQKLDSAFSSKSIQ